MNGYRQTDAEMLARAQALAAKKFPGRALSDLTEAERSALLEAFKSQKAYLYGQMTQPTPGAKMMGNVAVNNPWEGAAAALEKGLAGYQLGKLTKREELGKNAAVDLSSRAKYLQDQDSDEEWKRQKEMWQMFLGGAL